MKTKFKLLDDSRKLYINLTKNVFSKIPKVHTGYKELINKHSFLIIETIIRARILEKERKKYIFECLVNISVLEELIFALKESKIISNSKFLDLINKINELKRMTNGWLLNEKNKEHIL